MRTSIKAWATRPYQECHLERRKGIRERIPLRSRKTPWPLAPATVVERRSYLEPRRTKFVQRTPFQASAGRRRARGPSTPHDRRADDHAPLGMTELGEGAEGETNGMRGSSRRGWRRSADEA